MDLAVKPKREPLNSGVATLLVASLVCALSLFELLWGEAQTIPTVSCDTLIDKLQPISDEPSQRAEIDTAVKRYSPHSANKTVPDVDPRQATPQVLKVLAASYNKTASRLATRHCQAIYTDVAARIGTGTVEIPAHCFFSDRSVQDQQAVEQSLKDYCVYVGADIQSPTAIRKIKQIACKESRVTAPSRLQSQLNSAPAVLANDACLVTLDKPLPDTISEQPLPWWRPDATSSQTPEHQFAELMDLNSETMSCNRESGYFEASNPLHLVSHSIDYDGLGLKRVVATGRAVFQQSSRGIVVSPAYVRNNINTRSGDSGGAVYIYDNGVKSLVGVQVAIVSPAELNAVRASEHNADALSQASYQRQYNLAINPHLASDAVRGYPYRFTATD